MDPRRLLTFRAVARERSFSAAARALALTQPAVSQQVAALERELGARLLDREPGGLRLTPAGALWVGHPLAKRKRVPLAALADAPWVAPSDSGMIAAACREAGFTMRLTMISRDPLANRALISRGLAVTLVPRLLADEFAGVELR